MDYKSVLFSVEDAGQGLAFSPTAFEESALIDVHDQDVVAVDDIRYAAGVDRVRPGIQFLPNQSGSPHGSAIASQKSLSVSIC